MVILYNIFMPIRWETIHRYPRGGRYVDGGAVRALVNRIIFGILPAEEVEATSEVEGVLPLLIVVIDHILDAIVDLEGEGVEDLAVDTSHKADSTIMAQLMQMQNHKCFHPQRSSDKRNEGYIDARLEDGGCRLLSLDGALNERSKGAPSSAIRRIETHTKLIKTIIVKSNVTSRPLVPLVKAVTATKAIVTGGTDLTLGLTQWQVEAWLAGNR